MIKAIARFLGIGRDEPEVNVREDEIWTEAYDANVEARKLIHDSRNRRAVLQLRLDHIQRKNGR